MPRVKLDATFCALASTPPGKSKENFWDTTTTGFVLEVRSTGGKTYCLRYVDESGRQRQHKIANYGDITFAQAARKAQQLKSQVVLGGNPAAQKETKRSVPLYAVLAQQHLEHARTYQRSHADIETILRRHILPKWGDLRLDEIKQQQIALWLAEKREGGLAPATVEKIRVTFNRSFELGKQWNVPGAEINPVRGIPRPKFNNARERFLTAEEAERLLKAAERSYNPQLKAIVQLLLLTGARKMELLKAEWRHVDLERKAWLIPDSKTGKPRYVPLSQAAIDVIEGLVRIPGCPYLLPNPETRKPYDDIKRAWDTTRKEAKLPGLRIHDLRHSAASFMINAGVDLYAVGKVLGHADHQSTMRYSHLANDTLLAAVEAGAARMNAAKGGANHGV